MLICKNCNAKFDENYGVCPVCGRPYERLSPIPAPKPYTDSERSFNIKKCIIIGSFLMAVLIGIIILLLTILIPPRSYYITDLDMPYNPYTESSELNEKDDSNIKLEKGSISKLIKDEIGGSGKIRLKVWGSIDDRENIKAKIEEFESIFAIDDIEYDLYYVQISSENIIPYLNSDADSGGDVFYLSSDEFETAVEKDLLDEVAYAFYEKIEASNTKQAVKSCVSDGKLYAYPIISGDESRIIGVNDESLFPFTSSVFAMYLSGIDLSEYK